MRGKQSTYASHGRSANDAPQFTMLRDKPTILPPKPSLGGRTDSTISTPSNLEAGLARPAEIYRPQTGAPKDDKGHDLRPQTAPVGNNNDGRFEEKSSPSLGNTIRADVIWVKNEIRVREDSGEWPLTAGTSKSSSFV